MRRDTDMEAVRAAAGQYQRLLRKPPEVVARWCKRPASSARAEQRFQSLFWAVVRHATLIRSTLLADFRYDPDVEGQRWAEIRPHGMRQPVAAVAVVELVNLYTLHVAWIALLQATLETYEAGELDKVLAAVTGETAARTDIDGFALLETAEGLLVEYWKTMLPVMRFYSLGILDPGAAAHDAAGYVRANLSLGPRSEVLHRTYPGLGPGRDDDLLTDLPAAFLSALSEGGWENIVRRTQGALDAGIERNHVSLENCEAPHDDPGFEEVDRRAFLLWARPRLNLKDRALFDLVMEGLTDAEVGGRLGMRAETARKRKEKLHRTLKAMYRQSL